jgi:cytosine/adenosine deaminase-related metal-dependent hydrolase
VKHGIITDVGAGAPAAVGSGELIDAAGCALLPGLINAHTHLYQVLLRAVWEDLPLMPWLKRIYGAARVLRPEHFYIGSLLGCVEAIRSGVTTVCEHNFLNPHPECAFETVRAFNFCADDYGHWRDCAGLHARDAGDCVRSNRSRACAT